MPEKEFKFEVSVDATVTSEHPCYTAETIGNSVKSIESMGTQNKALIDYFKQKGTSVRIEITNEPEGTSPRARRNTTPGAEYEYTVKIPVTALNGNGYLTPIGYRSATVEYFLMHELRHVRYMEMEEDGKHVPLTYEVAKWLYSGDAMNPQDFTPYDIDPYHATLNPTGIPNRGSNFYNYTSEEQYRALEELQVRHDTRAALSELDHLKNWGEIPLGPAVNINANANNENPCDNIENPAAPEPVKEPAAPVPEEVKEKTQIEAPSKASPLIFDVNFSGTIDLVSLDDTVTRWDIDEDGFAEYTGWVSPEDGFLVHDINQDGFVNGHGELFGSLTVDGFTELTAIDSNSDGYITSEDQAWGQLLIWQDINQDGVSQAAELNTLGYYNIVSIDLGATEVSLTNEGHHVTHTSTFTVDTGAGLTSYAVHDVWFQYDDFNTVYDLSYTQDADSTTIWNISFLPIMRGYGTIPSLDIAMYLDSDIEDEESLISLVTDFTALTLEDIFAADNTAMDAVRAIMLRWANVDDVNPASRGPNVDAQELGFLEAMTGQPFLQQGYEPNPRPQAGDDLSEAFILAHHHFYATLAAQTAAGELFTGDFYYNIATDSIDGITGLNTSVLDDLETAAAGLSTTLEKEALWSNVVRMIEYTVGVDNLDGTSLGALEDAIDAAGSDLYFLVDSLVETPSPNQMSGGSGADTLTGTSGRDVINGNAGDDTLEGLGGIDELYGAGNDDTLIGGAGDDYLSGGTGSDTYVYHAGDGIDVVDDFSGAADRILLGPGFDAGDVTLTRVGRYNLQISLDNGTDTGEIVIADQFAGSKGIETIVFDDTTTIDLTALSFAQYGTAANDNDEFITSSIRCRGGV